MSINEPSKDVDNSIQELSSVVDNNSRRMIMSLGIDKVRVGDKIENVQNLIDDYHSCPESAIEGYSICKDEKIFTFRFPDSDPLLVITLDRSNVVTKIELGS